MTTGFDRIVLAVPDLSAAVSDYQTLLGAAPFRLLTPEGQPAAWWGLPNTVLELREAAVDNPVLAAVVFCSEAAGSTDRPVDNTLGLEVGLCDGERTRSFRQQQPGAQVDALSVDHLVLRTESAAACIELFRDQLGVRLALDQTVPEWGGRMLFFRTGKLTLEVIQSDKPNTDGNGFWGIAFQCPDMLSMQAQLNDRKVVVSQARDGRKPGTQVATIKSDCLNIPTLLIQQKKT